MVPTLRTDDGDVLTENAAILQYVAERFPDANLAPKGGIERARLQQWLCFIGTELHKAHLHAAARPQGAGGGEGLRAGARRLRASTFSRSISPAANSCSTLQRRRRVSVHGAELDTRGADRSVEMAGRQGLSRPHAQAAEHRARLGRGSSRCMPRRKRRTRRRSSEVSAHSASDGRDGPVRRRSRDTQFHPRTSALVLRLGHPPVSDESRPRFAATQS